MWQIVLKLCHYSLFQLSWLQFMSGNLCNIGMCEFWLFVVVMHYTHYGRESMLLPWVSRESIRVVWWCLGEESKWDVLQRPLLSMCASILSGKHWRASAEVHHKWRKNNRSDWVPWADSAMHRRSEGIVVWYFVLQSLVCTVVALHCAWNDSFSNLLM